MLVVGRRLYAEALAELLEASADPWSASAATPADAAEEAARVGADLALVSIEPGDDAGVSGAVTAIHESRPEARLVLLAAEPARLGAGLSSLPGVAGVVGPGLPPAELAGALRAARRGTRIGVGGEDASAATPTADHGPLLSALTARETEVLRLVAAGGSQGRVAEVLCISPQTVRTHLQSIMGKLVVHSRTELVSVARRAGLEPDRARVGGA